MIVTTQIECGPAEIEIEARVQRPIAAKGWDPGDGGECEIVSACRYEGNHPPLRCVPINLDALLSVLGPAAWSALEQKLFEAAADQQDDGPDADNWRGE